MLDEVKEIGEQQRRLEKDVIAELGAEMGFGNMMDLASECWADYLKEKDYSEGIRLVVGPCKMMVVDCSHNGELIKNCSWCCGSGWVTKKVKEVMICSVR